MNAEAEAYLQEITKDNNGYVADLVREGMAWAYADASKICRAHREDKFETTHGHYLFMADCIEGRAK